MLINKNVKQPAVDKMVQNLKNALNNLEQGGFEEIQIYREVGNGSRQETLKQRKMRTQEH